MTIAKNVKTKQIAYFLSGYFKSLFHKKEFQTSYSTELVTRTEHDITCCPNYVFKSRYY